MTLGTKKNGQVTVSTLQIGKSGCIQLQLGGSWNTPLNGVHYFRQRINIPESLAGQQAVLRVGTLKDSDATYINGICVGRTSYQYPPRIYQVPADLLRAGENEIVIRLVSSAGRPEFVKGSLTNWK